MNCKACAANQRWYTIFAEQLDRWNLSYLQANEIADKVAPPGIGLTHTCFRKLRFPEVEESSSSEKADIECSECDEETELEQSEAEQPTDSEDVKLEG